MTAPVWTRSIAINLKPWNYIPGLLLPEQERSYGKHRSAGKEQHNLGCFYDAGNESVHHTHLRKLALRQALTTDLATGRAVLTSI